MCYLCKGWKPSKAVNAAIRVWRKKKCRESTLQLFEGYGWYGRPYARPDWTKAPKLIQARPAAVVKREIASYQKRTRYQALPGARIACWGTSHDWSKS